ncbi:MAG: response regulator [Alphaproteobacteria bacterium]|nr:response regulator [Alphaproteobacteria bacterium]MCB9791424.1 response regulator [Alphaproteobacteria bacterium]
MSTVDWTALIQRLSDVQSKRALAELLVDTLVADFGASGASVYRRDGVVLERLAEVGMARELDLATRFLTLEDAERAMRNSHQGYVEVSLTELTDDPIAEIALAQGMRFSMVFPLGAELRHGIAFVNWDEAPSDAERAAVRQMAGIAALAAERIAALRDAQHSDAMLRTLLDNIDEGVLVATPDGRYPIYTDRLERISGWPHDQVEKEGWPNLVYPDTEYRAQVMATIRSLTERGRYDTSWTLTRANGEKRTVQVSSRVIPVEEGRPPLLMGIFRDQGAQERSAREEQVDEHLLALGRYTGMLVHDFNNLLGLVLGHAELIRGRRGIPDEVRQRAETIMEATRRGGALTQRVLSLFHPEPPALVAVDLAQELAPAVAILDTRRPMDVVVEVELDPGLPPVDADPAALHHTLLNLLSNAIDAVGEVGNVRVEASMQPLPEQVSFAAEDLAPGTPMIAITVRDDGPGFSPTAMEHLFELLYTERMGGHGLGLSVVQAVASSHRGAVHVRNDGGAVVTLYLHPSQRAMVHPQSGRGQRLRGDERVWLLDDEHALMEFMEISLRARGYAVRSFTSPEDLLGAVERNEETDLLILNVLLPGWHGRELRDELRRRGLTAPVMWASGFNLETAGLGAEAEAAFLRKPFSNADLTLRVREILDRRL